MAGRFWGRAAWSVALGQGGSDDEVVIPKKGWGWSPKVQMRWFCFSVPASFGIRFSYGIVLEREYLWSFVMRQC